MNNLSSGGALHAGPRTIWPVLSRQIAMAAMLTFAGSLFAGGLSVTTSVVAKAQESSAECMKKCKADERNCLDAQSSEELCDYDRKMCEKACEEK